MDPNKVNPVWLLEGYHGNEFVLLGVFLSEPKVQAAHEKAKADGYTDLEMTPYPVNARLWGTSDAEELRLSSIHEALKARVARDRDVRAVLKLQQRAQPSIEEEP